MNVSILIIVAVTCGGFCKEASSMPKSSSSKVFLESVFRGDSPTKTFWNIAANEFGRTLRPKRSAEGAFPTSLDGKTVNSRRKRFVDVTYVFKLLMDLIMNTGLTRKPENEPGRRTYDEKMEAQMKRIIRQMRDMEKHFAKSRSHDVKGSMEVRPRTLRAGQSFYQLKPAMFDLEETRRE